MSRISGLVSTEYATELREFSSASPLEDRFDDTSLMAGLLKCKPEKLGVIGTQEEIERFRELRAKENERLRISRENLAGVDPIEDVKLTRDGDLDMDDEIVPEYSFAEVLIRVCAVTKKLRPPRDFVIVPDKAIYLKSELGDTEKIRVFLDPPEPTPTQSTRPGTADRIDVYAERYRRRQALHHAKDAGEHLQFAREIRVAPNGRPIVVAEVKQTWQGNVRAG